jgi:uncharacterized protein YjfI (DUF2170 family)
MTKPVFKLILGCKSTKDLGIILDFRTKNIIIDHLILPMSDINSLTSLSRDNAWVVYNSMAHELQGMQEVTE